MLLIQNDDWSETPVKWEKQSETQRHTSFITDLEPVIQESSTFIDKANGIKLMTAYVICVFWKGPLNVLSTLSTCLHMCAIARPSPPVFLCTPPCMHSCRCVFINRANGFSAAPPFVCSVTQPGSRFIKRVFRADAWLTAANDLTPVSGRRGEKPGRDYDPFTIKARSYFDPATWKKWTTDGDDKKWRPV